MHTVFVHLSFSFVIFPPLAGPDQHDLFPFIGWSLVLLKVINNHEQSLSLLLFDLQLIKGQQSCALFSVVFFFFSFWVFLIG